MSSASLSARSASFFCKPAVRSSVRAWSAWRNDGASFGPQCQQRVLHRRGRLLAGRRGQGVLHLPQRFMRENLPSLMKPARRDDLLVQPLTVAADDHQPGVGDDGRRRQQRGPARPGP